MKYNVKEDYLIINDEKMNYISFGNGSKNLIMIQGFSGRSIKGLGKSFARMYKIFCNDYRVYLFDRRTTIKEGTTIKDLANDFVKCCELLGIKEAYVFGVSQGGMIAQQLTILKPDLVKKAVFALTTSRANPTLEKVINDCIEFSKENKMKELIKYFLVRMYSDKYIKKYSFLIPLLTFLNKPKSIAGFINLAMTCVTFNCYDELDKIKCPVFVIGGKLDKVVTVEGSLEIAEKLNCEKYIYEDFGHSAYEEAKDFNNRVYDFLNKE